MTTSITSVVEMPTPGQRKQYERVVRDAVDAAIETVFATAGCPTKKGIDYALRNGHSLRSKILSAVVDTTRDLSQTDEMLPSRFNPGEIEVVVDYALSLGEMLSKCNFSFYDESWFEDNRFEESRFKPKGEGQRRVLCALVRFNRELLWSDIVGELNRLPNGFRPGRVEHLLALEAVLPSAYRESVIMALGSVWSRGSASWENKGALTSGYGSAEGRSLSVADHDGRIGRNCHHLVVRE